MSERAGPLADASLRLERLQLRIDVGGRSHVVPVGPLEATQRWETVPWGDSGVTTWTELTLHLGRDGALWLERVDQEDIHLAGRYVKARRWFVSSDGAAWKPAAPPAEPGRRLDQVRT